ncbi:hypothetical protein K8Q94_00470 [Candidatus Nomurabacteria bacterium]|nr:hypothetical protein [Candidatus Nomurabacteria bacterium]
MEKWPNMKKKIVDTARKVAFVALASTAGTSALHGQIDKNNKFENTKKSLHESAPAFILKVVLPVLENSVPPRAFDIIYNFSEIKQPGDEILLYRQLDNNTGHFLPWTVAEDQNHISQPVLDPTGKRQDDREYEKFKIISVFPYIPEKENKIKKDTIKLEKKSKDKNDDSIEEENEDSSD